MNIDATRDPERRSFIDVEPGSFFPIQNLPFGVFSTGDERARCGVAVGSMVLDLTVLEENGLLPLIGDRPVFADGSLNRFASLGREKWREIRCRVSQLLDIDEPTIRDDAKRRAKVLHRQSDVQMRMPIEIGDYTDFYASREHATNVGTMFRGPDNALQPNWLHLPVGYHGRASSVVISGTRVRRPWGQTMPPGADSPRFGPSRALDFELEMGLVVGPGTRLADTVPLAEAEERIFGLVLVNDWSARDIQRWEYVPLGPFLGKSFCTSISPWIVTLDALAPFRCEGPVQDPAPLPYLQATTASAFDIELQVTLETPSSREPTVLSNSNVKHLYWSFAQQLTHHASNGCNIRPGDLMASGTISGPTPDSYGSMLELTWNRERPISLPGGETRLMIDDGDTVALTGWAQGNGYRVGFGSVTGMVEPANAPA